jgi:DNA helicase-2/ATP-dependent DNA helicase PcrA
MSKFSDPFVDRLYDPLADPDAWSDLPPIPDRGPDPAAFETIASTLTPEQAKAAAHQGPILVLAGAGTSIAHPRRHLHQ